MGSCYNTAVVDAPIEQVWDAIRNFHNGDWAPGVIESLQPVGDVPGTDIGARRLINGAIHETLLEVDADDYLISYAINDGPAALSADNVQHFVSELGLLPVTDSNQTFVVYQAMFVATDEDAVFEMCDPIYKAFLTAMQKSLKG